MKYIVSNKESDIKDLLLQLKAEYGEYAFISYIDGEYGIRVWVYNSLVYEFYNSMKAQNIPCIGISFKNNCCFLNNLCDHIIEIDDVEFYSTIMNEIEDNSQYSLNHANGIVPNNSYIGNDGWDLVYIRGIHSDIYENILTEMNFKNIFYTLHVDGARYINIHGCDTGKIYKINNNIVTFDNINTSVCLHSIKIFDKPARMNKTNNIAIWIRNTNKWEFKNTNKSYYETLFDYCIRNEKTCYVFQDLIPIDIPTNEYIIECNNRIKNRPDFDTFLNICNDCDIFIGADSGPIYLLMHQPLSILKICYNSLWYIDNNTKFDINTEESLINVINEFYG
jgi:hypothetical protein